MSIFGVILAFFGFHIPTPSIALLAFASGALQLPAIYFYYAALKRGEASETLAVMGGFSPAATALISALLLEKPFPARDWLAFGLMVGGGFVMFGAERFRFRQLLPPVLAASSLYGVVNVTQKIAFNHTNFVSGYVFFTLGTFAGSLCLLVRRSWRQQIFENTGRAEPRSRALYFTNRFVNGLGSFLVFYAISLTYPAMVEAISAVRYVVIFLGAYLLLRENFRGPILLAKLAATALIIAGLILAAGSGTATVSDRQQPYTPGDQACAQPALPMNILFQNVFRQNGLEQIAGGCGGNGEADIRERQQGEERKERDGHSDHPGDDVAVVGQRGQQTTQRRWM
jgi:drug/metabolite transporter (DMT)-like permease